MGLAPSTQEPCQPSPPLARSLSSPVLARSSLAPPTLRKSRSFMCGEGRGLLGGQGLREQGQEERVNFLIGDNESLDIKMLEEEEEGLESDEGVDDVIVTKALKVVMEEVKQQEEEVSVVITELPLLPPEVSSSQPSPLPSLLCCSDGYTPGAVLQGYHSNNHRYCTLHTPHSTLHTAHCTLHTAHCTLYTAHCTLHTVKSTIHTVIL